MSLTSLTTGISDYATRRAIQQLASKLNYDASPTFAGLTISGESLSSTLITQWSTAYSWGDHAGLYDTIGTASGEIDDHEAAWDHGAFLTAETDPVFGASPAAGILSGDIANWNTAFGWGNHAGLYEATGAVTGHETAYDHTLLHAAVTLGTANGLSLVGQEISLPTTARPTFDGIVAVRSVNTTNNYGCDLGIIASTSDGDLVQNYGQRVYCQATGPNNITSFLRANSSFAYHSGSGTIASLGCLQSQIAVLSTGVVTEARCVHVSAPNMGSSSGTIGTNIGLYIESQSHARITTAYGIRQVGSSDINNFVGKSKFGTAGVPAENVHAADTVRADIAFNLNGTDGVTQTTSAGKVCDVTALAGGIATAQTQITYAADGTYNFDATSGKVSSITITNGRITAITTAE